MILTTHQPIFLPWPGFFYKALRADRTVLLDNVQFPLGQGWMNRNRLKSEQGELWLTVPVWKKGRGKQVIRNVELCNEIDWRRKHLLGIRQNYAHAPYLEDHLPAVEAIYARNQTHLIDLNLEFICFLWDALGLKGKLVLQSDLGVSGTATDLLVSVCKVFNADTYLALPFVEKFLDAGKFRAGGIALTFARFSPPVYPQLWGDFRYNLSALDLLLNCGPKSLDILSRSYSSFVAFTLRQRNGDFQKPRETFGR